MRLFQCAVALALLAVCYGQYPLGYFARKQMTENALHKFLSAIRGGGRSHREFLGLTGSGSNPSGSSALPPPSLFRFGNDVTHVPPPPKIGAFYIAPPERNAPFYYGGRGGQRRPKLVQISEFKNDSPYLVSAESVQRPGPPTMQFIQLTGPAPASQTQSNAILPPPPGLVAPIQFSSPSGPSAPSDAGSLQEIIAKAAQKQHSQVLEKEQKAHPNAQINQQILVPGSGVGQQPIFINQFGQPFLAPALYTQGGPGQLQSIPPQVLTNGQGIAVLAQGQGRDQPQNIPQIKSQNQSPPHQVPLQLIQLSPPAQSSGRAPQRQRLPIPLQAQQLPNGGQLLSLPPSGPQFSLGQFAILPQGGSLPIKGFQGAFVPGNAILNQPHFTLVRTSQLPQPTQVKNTQPKPEKEEQPPRPLESSSNRVTTTISSPSSPQNSQMTAAIMQTQMEFSEPISKQ